MNKKRYKTIFFDWNKTLSNSLFWSQLADQNHRHHSWHKNIVNFIFIENKHLINDWMRGDFDENYIAESISNKFGYSNRLVTKYLAESCENMQVVNEEIFELIMGIRKKGIECVISTDNMDTFMKYTKPGLKLEKYFDDFLVLFENKVLKFDVNNDSIPFFDNYLKKKKLSYKDVLLIDDCIDKSGKYEKLGFDILQISNSDDFLGKLRKLAVSL